MSGGKYNYTDEQGFVPNWTLVDLQNRQATIGEAPPSNKQATDWQNEWYFNEEVSNNEPDTYSINTLNRGGR